MRVGSTSSRINFLVLQFFAAPSVLHKGCPSLLSSFPVFCTIRLEGVDTTEFLDVKPSRPQLREEDHGMQRAYSSAVVSRADDTTKATLLPAVVCRFKLWIFHPADRKCVRSYANSLLT
ncbi:hypothetical protein AC1031_021480 [Aphanomyces cochlioides]|nr:hypothetical protein AC1031_021480 [Aphanomyces cochlioides]